MRSEENKYEKQPHHQDQRTKMWKSWFVSQRRDSPVNCEGVNSFSEGTVGQRWSMLEQS